MAARRVQPNITAQLIEQLVRMAVAAAGLRALAQWGAGYGCAAVLLGNTVSESVSCGIMLAFAAVCLSQLGKRPGAGLLAAVLAIVGIGLPVSYFYSFFRSVSRQIKQMHLPRAFYRVELADTGIAVWM